MLGKGLVAWIVTGVLLVALVGAPSRVYAVTAEQEVEQLAGEAVDAYKAGNYDKAIKLLTRAYAIRPLSPLLYNLAKAYDKQGDVVKAYETYTQYVETGEADPKLEKKARERVAALEPEYKKKKAPVTTPPPDNANNNNNNNNNNQQQQQQVTPPPPTGPTPEELARKAWEERQKQKRVRLAIGVAVAVVGLAGIGTGVGLYAADASQHSQFAAPANLDENQKRTIRDGANPLAIGSTVAYIAGGVVLAASAYFLFDGLRPEHGPAPASAARASHLTLAPWVSPTGAGGVAACDF